MKTNTYSRLLALGLLLAALGTAAQTKFTRRIVMEEYTGTWCSNCPRGIAAIQHLEKLYGDRFVAISIHQDSYDPMKNNLYASGAGYPTCALSRMGTTDPFFGTSWTQADPIGIIHNIDYVLNQNCYGAVQVQAQWANAERTQIAVEATSTFAAGQIADHYRLAFVVLEDSMHGEGYQWAQTNQYVNDRDWLVMPEMAAFVNGTNPQYGMYYNHVAVDGLAIRDGIEGSISAIEGGVPQTFNATIDLSANTLIQDKGRLHVVALLLNRYYGDIENADECRVAALPDGSGISTPPFVDAATSTPAPSITDLQGRRLPAMSHRRGLYVVDGHLKLLGK